MSTASRSTRSVIWPRSSPPARRTRLRWPRELLHRIYGSASRHLRGSWFDRPGHARISPASLRLDARVDGPADGHGHEHEAADEQLLFAPGRRPARRDRQVEHDRRRDDHRLAEGEILAFQTEEPHTVHL